MFLPSILAVFLLNCVISELLNNIVDFLEEQSVQLYVWLKCKV